MIKERSWSSSSYRFGFNGMEKDNEVKGDGNSLDFGARIYDSRLGRWYSKDRYSNLYPSESLYSFSINSPVVYFDPNGNWVEQTTKKYYRDKKTNQLVQKKAHQIFKRTVLIDRHLVVHDAKIYSHDAFDKDASTYDRDMERAACVVQEDIQLAYGIDKVKGEWKINEEDEEFFVEKKRISVSVEFDTPIEIINNLDNIQSTDHLFILAQNETVNKLAQFAGVGSEAGGFVDGLGGNTIVLGKDYLNIWSRRYGIERHHSYANLLAPHEFGHSGGLLHMSGGVMGHSNPSSHNLRRLFKGPFKNQGALGSVVNAVRGQPGFPEKYKTFRSTEQREHKVDESGGGSGMGQIHFGNNSLENIVK